jgi:hypothetical protein
MARRYSYDTHQGKASKVLTVFIAALVIVAFGVGGYFLHKRLEKPPVIPQAITNNVNFPIYYPTITKETTIRQNTIKYSSTQSQVSFIVNDVSSEVTFAEQAAPDTFVNDPGLYPQFIEKLDGSTSFSSIDGTVNITLPPQTHLQTAVMDAKGTLLFVSSDSGNLTENEWKTLFNDLEYVQPNS